MYGKQMELFQEGGEVDEVSGNNIPLGSTAEEVRDDQPAMLSEGEMVVPADVVRYFGVEHFMNLRDQAKMGYKKMEAMGQFGTEEGQTLPDDTLFNAGGAPFTIEDIEIVELEEENKDDTIEAKSGALVRKYQEGGDVLATGTTLMPDVGRKAKLTNPQGLGQLVGSTGIGAFETKFYMDPSGQIHQIFSMEGLPSGQIDEDWIEIDSPFELRSYTELGGGKATTTSPATLARTDDGGGPDPGDDPSNIGTATFNSLGEWGRAFSNEVDNVLADIGNRMRGEETTTRKGSDFDPDNLDKDEYDDALSRNNPYEGPIDDDAAADAAAVAAESAEAAEAHGDASDMGADTSDNPDNESTPGDFNRGGSVRKYAVGGMTDDLLKTGTSDPNLGIISPYQAVESAMQQELPENVFSVLSQAPEEDKQAVANFVNSNYVVSDQAAKSTSGTTKNFAGSTFDRAYPDDAPIDINSIAAGMIAPKDGQLRGSLSELANVVTPASAQNTKNFGALKDSLIGNALLDVLGIMTQYALNPAPGPVAIVQGIASIMSPEVAKGFNDLKGIPQKEAAAAQRMAVTMNYNLQQMTPEELAQVGLYSTAKAMGLDPANMPANQSVVSVNTPLGEQLGILSGTPGKGFSHVSLPDGSIISTDNIKTSLNLDPDVYGNTVQKAEDAVGRTMASAVAPPEEAGEMGKAMQGGPGGFGTDDTPDDTINSSLGGYDYSTEGDMGFSGGNTDVSSQVDSFSDMGGFDVDSAMGGDAGGDTGTSDTAGDSDGISDTEGSGFKHGGFVHKRKGKKKKKRRGLAGR